MKIAPATLEALIEVLEVKFPDELPKKIIPTEDIHLRIGQQQVINYLKEIRETL